MPFAFQTHSTHHHNPILQTLLLISEKMIKGSDEAEGASFSQKSAAFVSWFQNAPGTRLSSKIELSDLRSRNAGRGVGNFTA